MSKTCPVCGTTYPDGNAFCPTDGTTLRGDDPTANIVGTVIADRYLVTELLGEGGMGQVYLARHVRLPQAAAIKVLHPGMVSDAAAVARFNREAANAARIEHERVARVFDFGETSQGLVYLAMEFVPGKTLRTLLEESGRLPVVRAANIVFQIAEGLDAAHRIGIVHRDLKPDNIIVMTDEHGVDRCKVVDFGIAKAVDSGQTQLTQVGMLVGTPEFMSPEQVLGEPLDGRSDVYALGIVAFQLFSGTLPFSSGTPERSLTARLIEDPKPLAEVAADIPWPESLQEAVNAALAREPDARAASALEFGGRVVAAVEQWMGVPVLRARTPLSTPAMMAAAAEQSVRDASPSAKEQPASASTLPVADREPVALDGRVRQAQPGFDSAVSVEAPRAAVATKRSSSVMSIAAVVAVLVGLGGFMAWRSRGADGAASGQVADKGAAQQPLTAATPGDVGAAPAAGGGVATRNTPPSNSNANSGAAQPLGAAAKPGQDGSSREVPESAGNAAAGTSGSPTPGMPGAAPGDPGVGRTDRGASTADADAARREMGQLAGMLESDAGTPAAARDAIPRLSALLPRFTNATDSTWAYIRIATAYGIAGDMAGVCAPLIKANRLAVTPPQLQMIRTLRDSGTPTCKF